MAHGPLNLGGVPPGPLRTDVSTKAHTRGCGRKERDVSGGRCDARARLHLLLQLRVEILRYRPLVPEAAWQETGRGRRGGRRAEIRRAGSGSAASASPGPPPTSAFHSVSRHRVCGRNAASPFGAADVVRGPQAPWGAGHRQAHGRVGIWGASPLPTSPQQRCVGDAPLPWGGRGRAFPR